jgi:hypothetical protein
VTAPFLVVTVTPLFVTAYLFALLGVGAFCMGSLYMLASIKSYPWFMAFPRAIWRYIGIQYALSILFVVLQAVDVFTLPLMYFLLVQFLLLGFFAVKLLLLNAGRGIIEQRGEAVRGKVTELRFLQADLEAVRGRVPGQAKEIQSVVDAIRYSDPMSHASLAQYEDKIKDHIVLLEQAADQNDAARVSELCVTLQRLIKDRNNRVKMMK